MSVNPKSSEYLQKKKAWNGTVSARYIYSKSAHYNGLISMALHKEFWELSFGKSPKNFLLEMPSALYRTTICRVS